MIVTTETEQFLNEYKRLENVLRDAGLGSVLDYENSLATEVSLTSEQLKVCRIERNFLAHNDTGRKFLAISPAQTTFIKSLADKVEAKFKHAKDVMIRQKAITIDTTMKETITNIGRSKTGYIVVADKNGVYVGCLGGTAIIGLIAKKGSIAGKLSAYTGNKQIKSNSKKQGIVTVSVNERADNIVGKTDCITVVVDKNNKYKGLIM